MNTNQLIWQAISIGVMAGVPLTLLGEYFFSLSRNGTAWLHAVGLLLAAPVVAYSTVTGHSIFASTATTIMYFILQIAYGTVMAFLFLLLIQSRSSAS
jgi:hypothetical protein